MNDLFLNRLEQIIAERKNADAADSYTAKLFAGGILKIAQKVGEEGVETALAAVAESKEKVISEASDLFFHLMVLLAAKGISLNEIMIELEKRHK